MILTKCFEAGHDAVGPPPSIHERDGALRARTHRVPSRAHLIRRHLERRTPNRHEPLIVTRQQLRCHRVTTPMPGTKIGVDPDLH